MGKAIDRGWRKEGDPMIGQSTIVIGGLRGMKKKKSTTATSSSKKKTPKKLELGRPRRDRASPGACSPLPPQRPDIIGVEGGPHDPDHPRPRRTR